MNTQTMTGGCHCTSIRYSAEVPDPLKASRCNCTICAMKGVAMIYVPLDAVTVTDGQDQLACYQFNTMVAKHHFCPKCGIHLFHQARSDPDKYAINAATLHGVRSYEDFTRMPVFDGQRHSLDNDGVRRQAGVMTFEPTPDVVWDPNAM